MSENDNGKAASSLLRQQHSKVFDPRIISNEESKAVWSTQSVELALQGIKEGYELKESPFNPHIKKVKLRKAFLPFQYTPEEMEIFKHAMEDKIWFGNNFTHLKDGENGWRQIKLRPYQEEILNRYTKYHRNILMIPRQSGKTTTTVIEIVHFLCFNTDKDVVVIAQSEPVVKEILSKIREVFSRLPFFLSPGFIRFNDEYIELDNGCRLKIGVASESVVQGFSLDFLYVDEFAYLGPGAETFWINIYPALINNPNSKCIITSTPNGRNLFYTLWTDALEKRNNFVPYRLYWYDIPNRDEKFKEDTIRTIGIMGWELGFECNFDIGVKTIIPIKTQKYLREVQREYVDQWVQNTTDSNLKLTTFEKYLNYNDFSFLTNQNLRNDDYYLISLDIAEGLEQDYSVIKLIRVEWSIEHKRLEYRVVAVYHSNTVSVSELAIVLLDLLLKLDPTKIQVIIETNAFGGELFQVIDTQRKYNNKYSSISNSVFTQFRRNAEDKQMNRGIRWNSSNKPTTVKEFSNLLNNRKFIETYPPAIEEIMNFARSRDNVFKANYGHDDLVMCSITAVAFIRSDDLNHLDFKKRIEQSLRVQLNDEDTEIVRLREQEEKEERQTYVSANGFREVDFAKRRKQKRSKNLLIM